MVDVDLTTKFKLLNLYYGFIRSRYSNEDTDHELFLGMLSSLWYIGLNSAHFIVVGETFIPIVLSIKFDIGYAISIYATHNDFPGVLSYRVVIWVFSFIYYFEILQWFADTNQGISLCCHVNLEFLLH